MDDQNNFNAQLIEQFRASRERDTQVMNGRSLLLLTTSGARTGQRRTTPMMFIRDGGRVLVVASNAGAPKHPDWYRNLVAKPEVEVEIGKEICTARAVVQSGAERERLWQLIV